MANLNLPVRYSMRTKTEAEWLASDEVLLNKEIGFVSDKNYIYKQGDGVSKWSELSYAYTNVNIADPIKIRSADSISLYGNSDTANLVISDNSTVITSSGTSAVSRLEVSEAGISISSESTDKNEVAKRKIIAFGHPVLDDNNDLIPKNFSTLNRVITLGSNIICAFCGTYIKLGIMGSNNSIVLDKNGIHLNGSVDINGTMINGTTNTDATIYSALKAEDFT